MCILLNPRLFELVCFNLGMRWCECGCLCDGKTSLAGRIYIWFCICILYRIREFGIVSSYRSLPTKINYVKIYFQCNANNKANRTNEQTTCTQIRCILFISLSVRVILAALQAFATYNATKTMSKKFNCTGVADAAAVAAACNSDILYILSRIFFIWHFVCHPCAQSKFWIWEIRKMHIVCNK